MKLIRPSLLLLASLGACACGNEDHPERSALHATRIEVAAPAADAAWRAPETEVLERHPVQFAIRLTKDMPTPGYEVKVVLELGESGTIVARIDQIAPAGVASPQVMTPKTVRFALGSLQPGAYNLELHARFGTSGDYVKEQVVAVTAK
ncbi:MAG: hypothetical protein CMJ85_07870 [Planctomycetes bacterium]|jgi:hypothetical protein|nr:hypothetical protein [Planctomycetota bacterium]MDP6425329.1 hypothetical protein [Planctomycetota bacterium]